MIRVFPKRTKWTPIDDLAIIGDPPLFRLPEMPVKISCTFTWHIAECLRLQRSWKRFYKDVQVGGPAFEDPGGEFEPGRFLKPGVTITSRGCPKKCKYCFVPVREGKIREYPIHEGSILQDNNILACSEHHQRAVFGMLANQKQIDFNGGLDAELLRPWHVKEFEKLSVRHFWFACDEPGTMRHIEKVADLMSGYKYWQKRCYVLIGFNGETVLEAEKRLEWVYAKGFLPFAQLYQDGNKKRPWSKEWDSLQRKWCRPAAYRTKKHD